MGMAERQAPGFWPHLGIKKAGAASCVGHLYTNSPLYDHLNRRKTALIWAPSIGLLFRGKTTLLSGTIQTAHCHAGLPIALLTVVPINLDCRRIIFFKKYFSKQKNDRLRFTRAGR
jgi:hypothetical protein